MTSNHPTGVKKSMSLCPPTRHARNQIAQKTKLGRKHWDLFRYLLDPHILCDALRLVIRNGGAAGLDRQTVDEVRGQEWKFATEWAAGLRARTYLPGAVRRVYIPKKNGERRPLGIPDLRDRTIQRALVLLLEMIYEQKFYEFSYGFRPNRRATDCVADVAKTVFTHRQVLEVDIAKFFDKVPHHQLLQVLKEEIADPRVIDLIKAFLKAGFREPGKPWQPSVEGTPQGGPLSPLLANIYLHYFLDKKFVKVYGQRGRVHVFRYADDLVFAAKTKSELKTLRQLLNSWMRAAGLSLKEEKTREVDMSNEARGHSSKFDFLGFKLHLRAFRDNPKRFWVARQPSESSRKSLRLALRARLLAQLHPKEIQGQVRLTWVGWCNYFRHGNANRILYREYDSVKRLVWRYLRRKFRRSGKPVRWKRLQDLADEIMTHIRPVRVQNQSPVGVQLRLPNVGGA